MTAGIMPLLTIISKVVKGRPEPGLLGLHFLPRNASAITQPQRRGPAFPGAQRSWPRLWRLTDYQATPLGT